MGRSITRFEGDAVCEDCGDFMEAEDISVEAFEETGQLLCPACADEALTVWDDEDEDGAQ